MFFLVCKLCRLSLFIRIYFGQRQYSIWEFLVLPFIETTRLNTTPLAIFPDLEMTQVWSRNYICQVCKLKLLFSKCPKFWRIFILINSYLELSLNILYHRSLYSELFFLVLTGDCGNLLFKENIFKVFLYLWDFLSKN